MTRVLVAVDATESSIRAARIAHRLFGDDHEYLAVNVASPRIDPAAAPWWGAGWGLGAPMAYGGVWPYQPAAVGTSDAGHDVLEEAAEDARAVADRSGLPEAEAIGEVGDPADAIIRAAEEHHVDVIVVGTEDRSWFDRLLRPSVSTDVLKEADVPVLVVK